MENILEYLIPLIFIFSFLSMLKKKKKKAVDEKQGVGQPEQKGQGGISGRLTKMLKEYYEADLKGAPEKPTENPRLEDPFDLQPQPRELEPWEDEDDFLQPASMTPDPETAAEIEEEHEASPEPAVAPVAETKTSLDEPDFSEPEQSRKAASAFRFAGTDKAGLRKAIVWSEILGPPKALRNE